MYFILLDDQQKSTFIVTTFKFSTSKCARSKSTTSKSTASKFTTLTAVTSKATSPIKSTFKSTADIISTSLVVSPIINISATAMTTSSTITTVKHFFPTISNQIFNRQKRENGTKCKFE